MSAPTLQRGIADRLRAELDEMRPGDPLRSENQLMALHDVSRHTVRAALRSLENCGLVEVRKGRGRVKADLRPAVFDASAVERSTTGDDTWAAGVRASGRVPSQRLRVEIVEGPRWVTDQLCLPAGEVLVVRRRWRYADSRLMNVASTYFQESLVRGTAIMLPTGVVPGTYRVMEELGRPWVPTPSDEVITRMLTEQERELFRADLVGVAEWRRIRWSTDGAPTALTVIVLPGDRNIVVLNPRGGAKEELS